ncbi:MAG: hypothetical protein H6819_01595 [Phycisphaerales bacterium]|nr:hypothetical protein [Phycisphaerales bacterium]MCB9857097.1 hypothetical protein [Phycisphaerales bacterium]MCB9861776.1 hypothetical protein [Phycisphaerales bacterium]
MLKQYVSILFFSLFCSSAGCSNIVKFAVDKTQPRGVQREGVVYYVGGAGPVGNIGSFDIPRGLRDAGFGGVVEVYPWQSWTHAGDQLNITRNREKAAELADQIQRFRRQNPDAPIHIVALSAGTGIATFALEYLPESTKVDNVAYLGCSMSAQHDMTRALRRVRGKLYVLHAPGDAVLSNLVWYTGTVDRKESRDGIAGLEGFHHISSPYPDTDAQYEKLVNVSYRNEFRDAGYDGGHVSATTKTFVQFYLAPALMDNDRRLVGNTRRAPYRSPFLANSRDTARRPEPRRSTASRDVVDPLRRPEPVVAETYPDGTTLNADAAPDAVENSAGQAEPAVAEDYAGDSAPQAWSGSDSGEAPADPVAAEPSSPEGIDG